MNSFDDQPDAASWSFDKIRLADETRAEALENAPKFVEVVDRIVIAAGNAVKKGSDAYFWQCGQHSQWEIFRRPIFQFPVEADQFDFFWNARTGFRAQFWLSPEIGARANAFVTEQVTGVLPAEQRLGSNGWPLFDSVMSKCWFAETVMKFSRDVLITYSANASEIVVVRWQDVRALRPPDGEAG